MKMRKMSEAQTHEQQEIALGCIIDAHDRSDALDEAYFTFKLMAADARDVQIGCFEEKPLINSDGFMFLL